MVLQPLQVPSLPCIITPSANIPFSSLLNLYNIIDHYDPLYDNPSSSHMPSCSVDP